MKQKFFLLVALTVSMLFSGKIFAQSADDIIGTWMVGEKDAKVEIYKDKSRGKYCGKVIWTKTDRVDEHNPNPELRSRKVAGIIIFDNFYFEEKSKEYNGNLYNSRNGKTYTGYMKMQKDGTLFMKGYIMGMKWLGKSDTWTRVN